MSARFSLPAKVAQPAEFTQPLQAADSSATLTSAHTAEKLAPTASAHAPQLVREIRDIADGLWALDRNSVEVRFNFNEQESLSVKIEYKQGTVHTTFKTDSTELRDTIAHEWQAQIAADTNRPYLVTTPVFNSARSGDQDSRSASSYNDSQRQQQQQPEQQQAAPSAVFPWETSRSRNSAPTTSVAAPQRRPETARHLHTFA